MIAVKAKTFFDKNAINKRMDRKGRKALSSAGAYGRAVMKNNMKRSEASSAPGEYPNAHVGTLKDMIRFAYDVPSGSVVVGPVIWSGRQNVTTLEGGKTLPQIINEGGTEYVQQMVWQWNHGRREKVPAGVRLRYSYEARPFVELTLPLTANKLADNMATIPL